MDINSILNHENENNTKKKKRNFFLFALPVIVAGVWFFGIMISAPARRQKDLESIRSIDARLQTAAVPYVDDCCLIYENQLNENRLNKLNELISDNISYTYEPYNENEMNSGSWGGVLSRDKSQSVDAFLRLRGGGSGGGPGLSTAGTSTAGTSTAGISTAGISTAGRSAAGRSAAARLSGRTSTSRGEGSVPSGAVGRRAGTSSEGARNLNPPSNPLRASTRDSTSDLFSGASSSSRVQDRSGGKRPSWLSSCLEATSNCLVCCDTEPDKASVPAYRRAFEPPFEQMMERNTDSPTAKYRDPFALHFSYKEKVQMVVIPNKTFGVICEGRIEEARITGQPDETKINQFRFGRQVFLNCALGENREVCYEVL